MMKRIITLAICGLMLTGCTSKSDSTADTATTTTPPAPTEPVDLATSPNTAMYERALMNEGNLDRVAAVIKKSKDEATEYLTIGYIGGSITQGSSVKSSKNSYVNRVSAWWEEHYKVPVRSINAGIGATDSYIGVHRATNELLKETPDIIFVEFSVNDTKEQLNKDSYDSLVRMLLSAENKPAVVLVFTTMEDGTNLQHVHKLIGEAYDLPMISYREAVIPEVNAGTLAWTSISPDNIHPNDEGHKIVAGLISKYIENVEAKLDTVTSVPTEFTTPAITSDKYKYAYIANRSLINPVEEGEWTKDVSFQKFTNGWGTEKAGSSLKFEVESSNLGLLYKKTVDGKSGSAAIIVDGELLTTISGDFPNGWGNYVEAVEVFTGTESKVHTVEIKVIEGEKSNFEILGLLVS